MSLFDLFRSGRNVPARRAEGELSRKQGRVIKNLKDLIAYLEDQERPCPLMGLRLITVDSFGRITHDAVLERSTYSLTDIGIVAANLCHETGAEAFFAILQSETQNATDGGQGILAQNMFLQANMNDILLIDFIVQGDSGYHSIGCDRYFPRRVTGSGS